MMTGEGMRHAGKASSAMRGLMRSIARTGVQAPLGVELGVTGELGIANGKDLDPDELGDGEGQGEAGVGGGAVQLNLASVNPAREEVESEGVRQRRERSRMCDDRCPKNARKTGVASRSHQVTPVLKERSRRNKASPKRKCLYGIPGAPGCGGSSTLRLPIMVSTTVSLLEQTGPVLGRS